MNKIKDNICPICKGSGKLPQPCHVRPINNKIMATLLKKEGYSFRQIMKFLNYKSPRSIQYLLEKK